MVWPRPKQAPGVSSAEAAALRPSPASKPACVMDMLLTLPERPAGAASTSLVQLMSTG